MLGTLTDCIVFGQPRNVLAKVGVPVTVAFVLGYLAKYIPYLNGVIPAAQERVGSLLLIVLLFLILALLVYTLWINISNIFNKSYSPKLHTKSTRLASVIFYIIFGAIIVSVIDLVYIIFFSADGRYNSFSYLILIVIFGVIYSNTITYLISDRIISESYDKAECMRKSAQKIIKLATEIRNIDGNASPNKAKNIQCEIETMNDIVSEGKMKSEEEFKQRISDLLDGPESGYGIKNKKPPDIKEIVGDDPPGSEDTRWTHCQYERFEKEISKMVHEEDL